jgi:hypothetical protein
MACPFCGYSALSDAVRFCPTCGEPITQPNRSAATITVNQQVGNIQSGKAVGVEIDHLSGNVIIAADEEERARRRRNLRILLNKVKQFWIVGVLERSLAGAVLLELNKQYFPELIERPLNTISPIWDRPVRDVPVNKSLAQIFDENDHALLIVDGIGSGKTTTLLELTRDSIAQAEQDPTQPIPVVLNLSSWTPGNSIASWAIDELSNKYQIPRTMGRDWLESNDITLLLDGLLQDSLESLLRI